MKTVFLCDHCGFECNEAHEAKCEYNPINKTCATCKHCDFGETREQQDKWTEFDDDGDEVASIGCLVFNDQKFRDNCDKWERKQ